MGFSLEWTSTVFCSVVSLRETLLRLQSNHSAFVKADLGGVAQDSATIGDQDEIDGLGEHDQVHRSRGRDVGRVVRDVELTSARHVDVAAGLVGAREQAEVEHIGADVHRRVQVGATEGVGGVVAVEGRAERLEDVNAVSLKLDRRNGLGVAGVRPALHSLGRTDSLDLGRSSIERHSVVDGELAGRHRGRVNLVVAHQGQVVPITVLVGVAGAHVPARAETNEHGLNRPLEGGQQNAVLGIRQRLSLHAMHADQGESDTLDENVVDLRVDEDVVDVQLHLGDLLGGVDDGARGQHGGHRLVLAVVSHSQSSGGTLSGTGRSRRLDGQTQVEVARGNEQDVRLSLEVNGNVALTVGDGNGRHGQSRVLVEPEQQRHPQLERGLSSLGGLRTVHNLRQLAGSDAGVHGCTRHSGTIDVKQTGDLRSVRRRTGDGHQVRVGGNGHLLTDQASPSNLLVGMHAELLVEQVSLSSVLVQRVSVHVEADLLAQALSGELGIAHKVGGSSTNRLHIAGLVNVLMRKLSVHTTDHILSGRNLGSRRGHLIRSADVGGESGHSAGRSRRGVEQHVQGHVGEEITELGNRESHGGTIGSASGRNLRLVVLVADGSERLEVSIDKEHVSALDVDQRRRRVGETGASAQAHNVLDALVQQLSGHNHTIRLAIIGNQLEDGSRGHVEAGIYKPEIKKYYNN